MLAYKLFRILKDGSIRSLFINKKMKYDLNTWYNAEPHLTKGYKFRKGFHCLENPVAPHLSEKNRAWFLVEIKNFTKFERPISQGGIWFLADKIKLIKKL